MNLTTLAGSIQHITGLTWRDLAGLGVFLVWEFFLGRTRRIKANSTLELILTMMVLVALSARRWVRHRRKGA